MLVTSYNIHSARDVNGERARGYRRASLDPAFRRFGLTPSGRPVRAAEPAEPAQRPPSTPSGRPAEPAEPGEPAEQRDASCDVCDFPLPAGLTGTIHVSCEAS